IALYQNLEDRRYEAEANDEPFDWNREKQLLALPTDSAKH
ncbi:PA2817 family protein, partial [Escherichia coli]|nr:PA2817 family protein [Escherichia coli]